MIREVGRDQKSVGSWRPRDKCPKKVEVHVSSAAGKSNKWKSGRSAVVSYTAVIREFRENKRQKPNGSGL